MPLMIRIAKRPRPIPIDANGDESAAETARLRDAEALALLNVLSARGKFIVNGEGITVAVVDTGVRHSHSLFHRCIGKSNIVASINLTEDNFGVCYDAWDGAGHGTHVAGIVLQVAPAAKLAIVKALPSGDGTEPHFELIDRSLRWVLHHQREYHISVVCLSLGDDQVHRAPPTADEYNTTATLIAQLTANDIAVVAAAGNHYAKNPTLGMCFPAILPDCISVGAVYDHDSGEPHHIVGPTGDRIDINNTTAGQVMHASARLPYDGRHGTTIFAPGEVIQSAGIRSDRALTRMRGTSQAAPYVAGTVALMQQYFKRQGHKLPRVNRLRHWLRDGATALADNDANGAAPSGPATEAAPYRLLDTNGSLGEMPVRSRMPDTVAQALHAASTSPPAGTSPHRNRQALAAGALPSASAKQLAGKLAPAHRSPTSHQYIPPVRIYLMVRADAQMHAAHLADVLTRPMDDPLARGPYIPVFIQPQSVNLPRHLARIRLETARECAASAEQPTIVTQRFTIDALFARRVAVWVATRLLRLCQPTDSHAPLTFQLAAAPDQQHKLTAIVAHLKSLDCCARIDAELPLDHTADAIHGLLQYVTAGVWPQRLATQNILRAKERQLPVIVLRARQSGRQRSLPYRGHLLHYDDPCAPETITDELLRQALQALHFALRAPALLRTADLPLHVSPWVRPPELLDGMRMEGVVLYPDPPLSPVEHQLLRRHHPQVRTATPTLLHNRLLAEQPQPALAGLNIALSMSFSATAATSIHQAHFVDLVVGLGRYLLHSGATLHYGGLPPTATIDGAHEGSTLPNFSNLLVTLAASSTAPQKQSYIHHYRTEAFNQNGASVAPQPFPDAAGGAGFNPIRTINVPTPSDAQNGHPPAPAAIALAYRKARALDALRARIAAGTNAQLLLGGKLAGYSGRYPGIVHEAYLALTSKSPIYLVGSFGGAAEAVGRALLENKYPSDERPPTPLQSYYDQQCKARGEEVITVAEMFRRIAGYGKDLRHKPDELWLNGLTRAENKQLFHARYVDEIVALVIRGVRRRAQPSEDVPLPLRLYRGSIGDPVARSEGYLLGCIAGVPLTGAALALPAPLQKQVTAALHAESLNLAPGQHHIVRSHHGSACFVGLPGLTMADVEQTIIDSIQAGVAACLRAGILSLTTVAIGASLLGTRSSVKALITATIGAWRQHGQHANFVGLTLCEASPERYPDIDQTVEHHQRQDQAAPVAVTKLPAATSPHQCSPQPLLLNSHLQGNSWWYAFVDDSAVATVPAKSVALDANAIATLFHRPPPCQLEALTRRCEEALAGNFATTPAVPDSASPAAAAPPQQTAKPLTVLGHIRNACRRAAAHAARSGHPPQPLVYICDNHTSRFPIEALRIDGQYLAHTCGIMRRLMVPARYHAKWQPVGGANVPLRILAIGDPTDDLPAARSEVDHLIKSCREQHANDMLITPLLGGEATSRAICSSLAETHFDIVHYAGHAFYDPDHPTGSGLLCADGLVLTAAQLQPLTPLPCLAVINACDSAVLPTRRAAAATVHAGVAEQFLRGGINHYIGANWRVSDDVAATFSTTLYCQLFAGNTLCAAVTAARRNIQHRDDWAAYVCYGHVNFRLRNARPAMST